MQAYHQQIANSNLPNGSAAPGLLVSTSQHNQHQQLLQHQHQQSNNTYQELVKAYLPQITGQMSRANCNDLISSSPGSPSMTSFAVRLMSLNAHELRCLSSDSELMRHIDKAQSLIENRLQDINSTDQFSTSDVGINKAHLHHQQQAQLLASNQLNLNFVIQNPQHEHLMLSTPDNYYQNLYVQQLAASNQQQQQNQTNQLLLMASRYHDQNHSNSNGFTGNSILNSHQNQLSNHQTLRNLSTSLTSSSSTSIAGSEYESTLQGIITQQHQQASQQNGLDLRTTPRPTSAISTTPSPNRAGSTGSGNSRYSGSQHPKKQKLTEYRRLQQLAEQASNQRAVRQYQDSNGASSTISEANENDPNVKQMLSHQTSPSSKRAYHDEDPSGPANTRSGQQKAPVNGTVPGSVVKKYKGEFDEPTLDEVLARERQLHKPGHYHKLALENGECACVIGSEFRDKTRMEALELLERWRTLDIDERVKWKWDVTDLPKDIPLSDIKKFEDLRRDYSRGRADFGGASKRKPLSIRGTRQFLLMLYCLHGHPGRDDVMQKEGYCPHCFAKIRTENEQSTLVRVVNHFNMKHRRGANPRLSPHLETTQRASSSSTVVSPAASPTQPIRDTLASMVESAAASVGSEEVTEETGLSLPDHKQEEHEVKIESDRQQDTSAESVDHAQLTQAPKLEVAE